MIRKSGLDSATLALHELSTRERVKVLSRLKEYMVRGTKGGFYAGEFPLVSFAKSSSAVRRHRPVLILSPHATVRVGRRPGVYTSWDECAAQVNGFQGSRHKKFPTEAEARAFVGGNGGSSSTTTPSSSTESTSKTNGTGAVTAALRQKRASDVANLDDLPSKRSKVAVGGASSADAAARTVSSSFQGKNRRRVFCDGSSRGNGQKGAVAGIGVFWSHEEGAP